MTRETKALIKSMAYEEMEKKSSHKWKERGNKYYHGERVASIALRLRRHLFPDVTQYDDLIEVAAWFHDIKNGVEMHNEKGADVVRELLSPLLSKEEMDTVYAIIYDHDKRKPLDNDYPFYLKLHQDADLLDHFGCFDIWTEIFHASAMGATVHYLINYLQFDRPGQMDYEITLLNYDISKKIMTDKKKFLTEFGNRFLDECTTGIANEEEIFGYKED